MKKLIKAKAKTCIDQNWAVAPMKTNHLKRIIINFHSSSNRSINFGVMLVLAYSLLIYLLNIHELLFY